MWRKPKRVEVPIHIGFITFDDVTETAFDIDAVVGRTVDGIHVRAIKGDYVTFDLRTSKQGLFGNTLSLLQVELGQSLVLPFGSKVSYEEVDEKGNRGAFLVFQP